mgnify:CR=1 FL=1
MRSIRQPESSHLLPTRLPFHSASHVTYPDSNQAAGRIFPAAIVRDNRKTSQPQQSPVPVPPLPCLGSCRSGY